MRATPSMWRRSSSISGAMREHTARKNSASLGALNRVFRPDASELTGWSRTDARARWKALRAAFHVVEQNTIPALPFCHVKPGAWKPENPTLSRRSWNQMAIA